MSKHQLTFAFRQAEVYNRLLGTCRKEFVKCNGKVVVVSRPTVPLAAPSHAIVG